MAARKATDEEIIQALQSCRTVPEAAGRLGMHERLVYEHKARLEAAGFQFGKSLPEVEASAQTYVITAAVNATKAHGPFLRTLELYCAARGAQLIVIPMRYRNPTRREEVGDDEWWDDRLAPYLTHNRTKIAKNLVVLADIKVQPTAINPLQGWLTVSGTASAILGHTKIALRSVATKVGDPAKLVLTTGACTLEQYSDTNAGKKGEFHHTLGAVVVEVEGTANHIRHICPMKDGSFIDLASKYSTKGIEPAPRADILVMGDVHAEMADPRVHAATKQLAELIRPKHLVLHDVLNFGSASHHAKYFEKFRRVVTGTSSVLKELQVTAAHVDELAGLADRTVMVGSNHHDHFTQWLEKSEHANDLENALVYHETKTAMLDAIHRGGYCDPFQYWMDKLMKNGERLTWLKPGESFAKHGYNEDSPSAWTHTHDITYANGKRTLVHCVGGRFYREDQKAAKGAAA